MIRTHTHTPTPLVESWVLRPNSDTMGRGPLFVKKVALGLHPYKLNQPLPAAQKEPRQTVYGVLTTLWSSKN